MLEVDKVHNKWFKLVELAKHYGYEFKAHDSLEDVKATLYCYYKFKKEQSSSFWYYKTLDYILSKMDSKVLNKAIEVLSQPFIFPLSIYYGKYVGVTATIKNYEQKLLFNSYNQLIDSHCTCLDCLDGGNKMCKHVVATLLCLQKNNNLKPYTDEHDQQNLLLYLKKIYQQLNDRD